MFGGIQFDNMDSMFGFTDDSYQGTGASCKTVTQKIGNVVTTYTQCS